MSSPLLPLSLEHYIQLATDREQTVSSNMANVDTPGFHVKDINFEREMQRASEASLAGMETVSQPAMLEVRGLMARPDGNNVDLDRESLLLAKTQLQYQLGVQLVKSKFHELLSAINGGS